MLAKPGITGMAGIAAVAGGLAAAPDPEPRVLACALVGTALVGAGANALNMVVERTSDGRMERTRNRPLPAGRMLPAEALAFGALAAASGVLVLAAGAGPLAALLGGVALVAYVLVYTPLKRATSLCTLVGAVPGAIPPLIGWAAVRGSLDRGAWLLFLLLFFWQLPHFLAIAWMWRDDYARGGFPMLPVHDESGAATARQMLLQSLALVFVSLLPPRVGLGGGPYLAAAALAGLAFTALAARFALRRTRERAALVFRASLIYLPLVLGVLVLGDRL